MMWRLMDGAAGYVFLAAMLALGLWHFALYLRAARPRTSDAAGQEAESCPPELRAAAPSLDEPAPRSARGAVKRATAGLDGWDVCAIAAVALAAGMIRAVMAYLGLPWQSTQSYPALIMHVLVGPYVLIGACYALVRRLGGGRMVCVLCTLIAAVNITWRALGVPFALLALVFVLRSMDDGRPRAANQAAAAVFAAFGIYLDASVALFAAGLWLIVAADGIKRPRAEHETALEKLVYTALLFPLTLAAAYLVMQLPGAAVHCAASSELGPWLLLRLRDTFAGLIVPLSNWRLGSGSLISMRAAWGILPDGLVCMLYGAVCAGLALWTFGKERDRRALIAGGAALISALALAFGEFWLAPVGSLLAAGYLWGRWAARGGKTQVLLGGGMLLALCVLVDLFALWSVH